MLRRTVGILALSVLVLSTLSCERVAPTGGFQREQLLTATSIPADWGNLVAVTASTQQAELTQLWFQDANGNIRVAVYHLRQNTLLSVTLFRRQ